MPNELEDLLAVLMQLETAPEALDLTKETADKRLSVVRSIFALPAEHARASILMMGRRPGLADDRSADRKDEMQSGVEMLKAGEASESVPDRQAFEAGVASFGLSATLHAAKAVPSLFNMTPAEVEDKLQVARRVLEVPDDTAESLYVLHEAIARLRATPDVRSV